MHRYKKGCDKLACGTVLTLALFAAAPAANALNYIAGGLGNFDAANFEGQDAYGFEIQIEGITPADLAPSWTGNKFGAPLVVPYAGGVYVRYQSAYDSGTQQFVSKTIPKTLGTSWQGTCYMGYPSASAYLNAGCDHFGVHLNYTAMTSAHQTTYRWMFADPNNPGQLVGSPNSIMVATPTYYFQPAPVNQPTAPPVLVAEVDLPPPPLRPVPQYGDAVWMKVFKTEMNREVALDELTSNNPDGTTNTIVPQDAAQLETEWKLMQQSPPPDGNHRQRGKLVNEGTPNIDSKAVIRRYESYAYTGLYDNITHEATCAGDPNDPNNLPGSCNAPMVDEVGDMLAAQMAAVNIVVPSLTVTTVGSGKVESADKIISCGGKCTSPYALNTVVTLTAQAASNNTFTGWTGACTGATLTCNITVNDAMNVTATFKAAASGGSGGGGATTTLSVKSSGGKGVVTSNPAGINCGNICSTNLSGKTFTLTATPEPGFFFVNWSGACTGSTCTVAGNNSMSVQANFSK
ncbi:hypothetical protein [Methylobacter sp.]|uniref:InlB B-repeat-containing protein n=1 Tax=Methylobacter sp. TaxID=2051955 RepID=UPI001218ECDC|nr:hypothetical protein [Methylobacter sp.]TAK62314.1 MAG: hypothetical protein EPO18_10955 [Methylobacter sp.]